MNYKPYPKYKDSGVEWLGDVPEGWGVKPLKTTASFNDDVLPESFGDEEEIEYVDIGSVSLETGIERTETFRFADAPSRARRKVRDGDVIASTVRTYLKAIAPVVDPPPNLIVSTGFAVIRPRKDLDPHFAKFSLQSNYFVDEVISRSTGVSYPAINSTEMAGIAIALPPLPEQNQIASFLDRECGKLDALQAKQERLIALLKEKRQALISHAVTRGLDPTAKLKPSGIEWLGDVPVGWAVTRIKFHQSRFEQGWSPQCEGRNKDDGEFGVLKVGCVNGGTFRIEEHKALPPELEPRIQYVIRQGDLLISRANTRELVGSAAVVDRDYDDILLCDKLYRLRFRKGVSEVFLCHFLGTSEVRQQIELDATGASASMVNIGQDCIKELHLALPPLAEQRAIVAHLDEKCGKMAQLKAKAERAIVLLKERRSALISAAVTGKIDVREAD